MKLATWNVNSIRVRLDQVLDWLEAEKPDLLAIQETKIPDDKFPAADFEAIGYHAAFNGQKTYNGVATLSRTPPADIVTDIPGLEDPQRRVLGATYGDVRLLNLYVPNGQEVGSDKFAYKLAWLDHLTKFVEAELASHDRYVIVGDFNVAPTDDDVWDPKAWEGKVHCSPPEREAIARLLDLGLEDVFRLFDQPDGSWSWWDYRTFGFRKNQGLRIDLILASRKLAQVATSSHIDRGPRGLERPSDHAPVVAEFTV